MPTVKSNQIEIAYEIHGEGPPLLLIAGIGYGGWFWHKIVPGLAKHFGVITFDNRGAGDSSKPPGPYTIPQMAADTIGLLEALEIPKTHVFGHSLGGFVAQELAVTRPDLVDRLILGSTTHGGMQVVPITPEALDVLTRREGDPMDLIRRGIRVALHPSFPAAHPDVVQELIDYRLTNPVPPAQFQAQVMAGAGMSALTEEQVAERMAALQMPVLVLTGDDDRVVPAGNADLLVAKLPNARLQVIPQTGHLFPIEKPEATVRAVLDFLLEAAT